jgi:hypothetical protein
MVLHLRASTAAFFLFPFAASATHFAPGTAPITAPIDAPSDDLRAKAMAKDIKGDGWTNTLNVGATGSGNRAQDVIGTTDGTTVTLGLLLDGNANLVAGRSEWLNTFKVTHTQTQTPLLERFVKSIDTLDVGSTLLHRRSPDSWLGPYARVRASTAIFPGYTIKTAPVTVRRTPRDGEAKDTLIPAKTEIHLTDFLEPLVVAESIGLFAHPTEDKALAVKSRLGAAVQHIAVRDGYGLADVAATPEIELVQLRNASQAGAEAEVAVNGLIGESLSWRAKALFFQPLYSTSKDERALRLNSDLSAGLSVKIGPSLSLEYQIAAKKVPLLLDKWQIQHGVVAAASFKL